MVLIFVRFFIEGKKMIKIFIQGMADGQREVEVEAPVEDIPELFPEFFGNVYLEGIVKKIAKRFSFSGTAYCYAKLICDRSLQEYEEEISAEIKVSFLSENLHQHPTEEPNEDDSTIVISEEDKYLDLTEIVREELAVNLPLKRIAPEYRDKDLDDIFPEYSPGNKAKDEDDIDDRWSVLKKVKLNSLNNN